MDLITVNMEEGRRYIQAFNVHFKYKTAIETIMSWTCKRRSY